MLRVQRSAVTQCRAHTSIIVDLPCYVYRDPLSLSVVHVPVCVSFAFFDGGKFMLIDPTQKEQQVADGMMMVAMNKHREVCMIETTGCVELMVDEVSYCCCLIFRQTDIPDINRYSHSVNTSKVTQFCLLCIINQQCALELNNYSTNYNALVFIMLNFYLCFMYVNFTFLLMLKLHS